MNKPMRLLLIITFYMLIILSQGISLKRMKALSVPLGSGPKLKTSDGGIVDEDPNPALEQSVQTEEDQVTHLCMQHDNNCPNCLNNEQCQFDRDSQYCFPKLTPEQIASFPNSIVSSASECSGPNPGSNSGSDTTDDDSLIEEGSSIQNQENIDQSEEDSNISIKDDVSLKCEESDQDCASCLSDDRCQYDLETLYCSKRLTDTQLASFPNSIITTSDKCGGLKLGNLEDKASTGQNNGQSLVEENPPNFESDKIKNPSIDTNGGSEELIDARQHECEQHDQDCTGCLANNNCQFEQESFYCNPRLTPEELASYPNSVITSADQCSQTITESGSSETMPQVSGGSQSSLIEDGEKCEDSDFDCKGCLQKGCQFDIFTSFCSDKMDADILSQFANSVTTDMAKCDTLKDRTPYADAIKPKAPGISESGSTSTSGSTSSVESSSTSSSGSLIENSDFNCQDADFDCQLCLTNGCQYEEASAYCTKRMDEKSLANFPDAFILEASNCPSTDKFNTQNGVDDEEDVSVNSLSDIENNSEEVPDSASGGSLVESGSSDIEEESPNTGNGEIQNQDVESSDCQSHDGNCNE